MLLTNPPHAYGQSRAVKTGFVQDGGCRTHRNLDRLSGRDRPEQGNCRTVGRVPTQKGSLRRSFFVAFRSGFGMVCGLRQHGRTCSAFNARVPFVQTAACSSKGYDIPRSGRQPVSSPVRSSLPGYREGEVRYLSRPQQVEALHP